MKLFLILASLFLQSAFAYTEHLICFGDNLKATVYSSFSKELRIDIERYKPYSLASLGDKNIIKEHIESVEYMNKSKRDIRYHAQLFFNKKEELEKLKLSYFISGSLQAIDLECRKP
ncbi:MAG: hypothetical protein AB7I27_04420 [Bacteriovoracaceae bacterium]